MNRRNQSNARATPSSDFPLKALYDAVDAQREARGLTWTAVVREMSRPLTDQPSRSLAVSTVKRLRTNPVAEGDGVLQMLRWLGRSPESFLQDIEFEASPLLPDVGSGKVIRFDTKRLYAAVNAMRISRRLTWQEAACEMGSTPSSLMHLSKGGRTGFPHVMRITRWLHAPVAQFVRATNR